MKKFIYGASCIVSIILIGFNVSLVNTQNDLYDLVLSDIEATADNEWNSWNEWVSQGLTKDEREWMRPCPSSESSSGNGSISNGNIEIGGGSHSQTNPSGRYEITCPYGNANCTAIGC